MSWQDCGLYWAWRGGREGYGKPPTEKLFERAPIYDERGRRWMEIAVGVWDGRKYTPMHRNEAKARGAYISKWHGSQAQYVHLKKQRLIAEGKDPNDWRNYW